VVSQYLTAPHSVIRVLSERVEKEHAQHLRDAQRVEDRSAMANGGRQNALLSGGGVDFESLVAASNKATMQSASSPSTSTTSNGGANSDGWEDDMWGSILGTDVRVLGSFLSNKDY
jgi:SCY1-like protein 2